MYKAMNLAVLALITTGCGQQDNRICETPATEPRLASHCVHREAYLMADAEGSIADIAKAAAHKCNSYVLNDSEVWAGKMNKEYDKVLEFYEKQTLNNAFQRVTESRSGNCNKPEN